MEPSWDPQACAAIDALRSGVVNCHVVRDVTYGRNVEIEHLEGTITESPTGSCQLVIGGYGVGKSHLCEVLDERLQDAGYAVARLELGAAHGRAENPNAVLDTIDRSIGVRVNGRQYRGSTELAVLVLSAGEPKFAAEPLFKKRQQIYAAYPGESNVHQRYAALHEACLAPTIGEPWVPKMFQAIPSSMTAANLAVAAIVQVAHYLRSRMGIKGVVLLLDEAERSNWAYNSYRIDRAFDLMRGLALVSTNRDTSHLKHYFDDASKSYCPHTPSYVHSIFWFTHLRGLASVLTNDTDAQPIILDPFDASALKDIRSQIETLYARAYGGTFKLGTKANARVRAAALHGDTRSVVRYVVAALDSARLNGGGE